MKEYTLEQEFDIYKERHQKTILQAKITAFYKDKQESGIRIPFFMTKSPEKRAKEEVEDLFKKAPLAFESLYERAWNEYAECLP